MIIAFLLPLLIFISILLFLKTLRFGRLPQGDRLEKIKKSPHYKDGAFQNISHTPSLTEGVTFYEVLKEVFFRKRKDKSPLTALPSVKTDLHNLSPGENVLIWFGHSSYFMQIDGKRILIDPVFSGSASPLAFGTKAFKGTDIYTTDDIPAIDFLFITHDHWDHLDYKTIRKLKPKIKTVICGLGVGEHLERWGFDKNIIIEKDWFEEIKLDDGFTIHTTTARHFSGRGFKRNKSLWLSFVLQTPTMKIFIGGDSGYDKHFAEIGNKFGEFDLAILENGQYDRKWRYIHMLPDEILKAAAELKAKRILPVHSSKFMLSTHAWYEPLTLITKNNLKEKLNVITPMIGEKVNLKDSDQKFSEWWKNN